MQKALPLRIRDFDPPQSNASTTTMPYTYHDIESRIVSRCNLELHKRGNPIARQFNNHDLSKIAVRSGVEGEWLGYGLVYYRSVYYHLT